VSQASLILAISVNKSSSCMYGGGVVEMPLQLKLRRLKSLRVPSSFTIICCEAFGDAALPNENSPVDSGRVGSKSDGEVSCSVEPDPNGVAAGFANKDGWWELLAGGMLGRSKGMESSLASGAMLWKNLSSDAVRNRAFFSGALGPDIVESREGSRCRFQNPGSDISVEYEFVLNEWSKEDL